MLIIDSGKTLLNCVSLIQIFKSRTEANKDLIWGLIRSEQERIFVEVCIGSRKYKASINNL